MMESRGVGKILSEPKGITQNNEKLTVKQGQQIPIQTSINNTVTTQYVDAVLELDVTPQITSEGTVFLDITVQNTQIDKSISVLGQPGLDTQSTQTKVLITDGGTVVIGGVVITNQTTTINQVPLLGQRAADRQPFQTHFHRRFHSGVDVLRDSSNFAGLSSARYNIA